MLEKHVLVGESVLVVVPGSDELRRGEVVYIFPDGACVVRVDGDAWTLQRWEVDGTAPSPALPDG